MRTPAALPSQDAIRLRPACVGRLAGGAVWTQLLVACASALLVWALFVRTVDPADLFVFLRAGQAVAHGFSPYVDPSSASLWSGHAFVYPSLVAWVFVPLGAVSIAAAGLLFYLGSVVALVAVVKLLGAPRGGAVPIMLTLTAEPVVRGLQLGTLNVWLLLGLSLAWRYRERGLVVVAALTAVVVAKLFLLPMLVWLLLTKRTRSAVATAALSAAAVAVSCALADLSVGSFARMLSLLSLHEGPHSSSLTAIAEHLGAGHGLATAAALVAAALIVGAGALRFRRSGNEAYLFCACVLASIAVSPIVWSHYFTLLVLIPLILRWRTRSLVLAWCATWLAEAPVGVPALHFLHPFPAAGWIWGALLTAAALAWRHRENRIRQHPPAKRMIEVARRRDVTVPKL